MPPPRPAGASRWSPSAARRNEVDSEELAGRLAADGWELVAEPRTPTWRVVNTCGFVEAAKKDSIDTLLAAADLKDGGRTQAVVAVGCLAERYGDAARRGAARGRRGARLRRLRRHLRPAARRSSRRGARAARARATGARCCRSRRRTGGAAAGRRRSPASTGRTCPTASPRRPGPRPVRLRLGDGPTAAAQAGLAAATGAARSARSRPSAARSCPAGPPSVLAEAALAGRAGRARAGPGERELHVVRQGPRRPAAARDAAARAGRGDGIDRVRVSYLQPAEMRPALVEAMTSTPGVAPYFDLSFQHAQRPGAAPDAPVRRHRPLPRAGRARSGRRRRTPASGPTSSSASPARPRTTSPSSSGSSPRRGSTSSACSATPTRTAPRRRRTTASCPDEVVTRAGRAGHRRWSRSSSRSAPRSGSARSSRCWSRRSTARRRRGGPRRPPGARGRRQHDAARRRPPRGRRPGRRHRGRVGRGADLVARVRVSETRATTPQASAWNIANALTVLRLVLVPVFLVLLFHDDGHDDAWRVRPCTARSGTSPGPPGACGRSAPRAGRRGGRGPGRRPARRWCVRGSGRVRTRPGRRTRGRRACRRGWWCRSPPAGCGTRSRGQPGQ